MPSETGFQTALESQTLFAMPYMPNPIRYKLKTTIQKTEIHIKRVFLPTVSSHRFSTPFFIHKFKPFKFVSLPTIAAAASA
ncbi:hypothetical protein I7S46_07985 [Neisseria meningitidis]|nr:hypothetical protein [Neisseria meningitidis]MBH2288131.1 hypothetical protein [Neisseria meningitidis]